MELKISPTFISSAIKDIIWYIDISSILSHVTIVNMKCPGNYFWLSLIYFNENNFLKMFSLYCKKKQKN